MEEFKNVNDIIAYKRFKMDWLDNILFGINIEHVRNEMKKEQISGDVLDTINPYDLKRFGFINHILKLIEKHQCENIDINEDEEEEGIE